MISKFHSATFTETAFLDAWGMGNELVTKVEGLYNGKLDSTKALQPNPYMKFWHTTTMNARIFYDGPAIKLQRIFDKVHKTLPIHSFTLQNLTLVRQVEELDPYTLKNQVFTHDFNYHTFGFKKGVFDRFGAETSPGQFLYEKFKDRKKHMKDMIPQEVYSRVRDCILMNDKTRTIKELKKLFLDMPYMMIVKEENGRFFMSDFTEA